MRVGVLVTGDAAVRAANSLAAHPGIDEVVVLAPATSRQFRVVSDTSECDYLFGTGPDAPQQARQLGTPLVWDGEHPEAGVAVHGANACGLALALAAREVGSHLVVVAHPDLEDGNTRKIHLPRPVGRVAVTDTTYSGHPLSSGRSPNRFAAALVEGTTRRVAIVDDAAFMSGIALAAGLSAIAEQPQAVWEMALPYLQTATDMGLVMAEEESPTP